MKKILETVFGKTPKVVYSRVVKLVIILLLAFFLIQNISCGVDLGWLKFGVTPAADININKEL